MKVFSKLFLRFFPGVPPSAGGPFLPMKAWVFPGLLRFAIFALVSLAVAQVICGSETAHLVPVEPDFGVAQPLGEFFKTTYEKSLFTKKDWLLRYYRADTPVNVTIGFSIYLKDQTFWVNVSHAAPEMDPLIRDAAEKDTFDVSSVLEQVDLKSFDFPISRPTAIALRRVWGNLLSEVMPDPSLRNKVFTDGPVVILFAKDESNRILSGKVPPSAEQNAKFRQVEKMFTDLMKACTASKKERAKLYRDIEARSQEVFNMLGEKQQVEHRSPSTKTKEAQPTLALISGATESSPMLDLNDSLQIPETEIPTLALGSVSMAGNAPKLTKPEAAAIKVAVEAFKKIYAKPDLRHYSVELKRRGNQLEVTFIAATQKIYPPGTAGTGGGSSFGPDMTYIVSLDELKIISSNFYR